MVLKCRCHRFHATLGMTWLLVVRQKKKKVHPVAGLWKSCNFVELAKPKMNKDPQPYSSEEESSKSSTLSESALALEEHETFVLPDEVDYASVVEGILQVTPDIEEEIAATDRGETVTMDEFKTMFAQWLD